NAVDAAVAAAWALGVCEPQASGAGGQTMMLIHIADTKRTFALDGSSRAPNRIVPGSFSKSQLLNGYVAATVPSTPAVLEYARRTYGSLPLSRLLEPAIRLAEAGVVVSDLYHRLLKRELKRLRSGAAGPIFLKNGEKAHSAGALFKQPALASTLRQLAEKGIDDFYAGAIAGAIADDMAKNKGLIHRDDLAQIPWPIERRPLSGRFENKRILTFPPPGAGRTLIEMLNIFQQFPPAQRDLDSPLGAVRLAEVIRRAFLDRRDRPFDPNFYPQIDDKRMLSVEYSQLIAGQVRNRIRTHGDTTHLTVMDRQGNIVALTQSIERVFGSGVCSPDLGFLYNNYMSAFEYEDISHPYYLRPNAVPWASVAPTIVFRGRRPWLALGSPGSERIASTILQVLLRLEKQSPMDAVAAPRLHCSLKGVVYLEASRMRSDIPRTLRKRGFDIIEREPFSFYLGCVQMVLRDKDLFTGVADLRRDGSAGGPDSIRS
ncbi:MAG: gamma-glutamyltransferase, partial [Candidatus Omnitrophica bacterium]|nr:gamma-glutamyltransferase [Candidatus Omnitrophota bacterium]